MSRFNSESGCDAGKRSKRGKAAIIDIETFDDEPLNKACSVYMGQDS